MGREEKYQLLDQSRGEICSIWPLVCCTGMVCVLLDVRSTPNNEKIHVSDYDLCSSYVCFTSIFPGSDLFKFEVFVIVLLP